jgi:hypothetical protein
MRPICLGLFLLLLLVGCGSGTDAAKSKLLGTWEDAKAPVSMPITYNADGTYIQVMANAKVPQAQTIVTGTYVLGPDSITTTGTEVKVYGLPPGQADALKAQLEQGLRKPIRTSITWVNDNEIRAEAGGHQVTFRKIAGPNK